MTSWPRNGVGGSLASHQHCVGLLDGDTDEKEGGSVQGMVACTLLGWVDAGTHCHEERDS